MGAYGVVWEVARFGKRGSVGGKERVERLVVRFGGIASWAPVKACSIGYGWIDDQYQREWKGEHDLLCVMG